MVKLVFDAGWKSPHKRKGPSFADRGCRYRDQRLKSEIKVPIAPKRAAGTERIVFSLEKEVSNCKGLFS